MLNRFPLWKNILIILVVLFGVIYALPNLYPDEFAIQVSGESSSKELTEADLKRTTEALEQAGIDFFAPEVADNTIRLRFDSNESQLRARSTVERELGDEFVVALNLLPSTPDWLESLGAEPMKLGLDLRGGVHFLMEVDLDKALQTNIEVYQSELKTRLREEKLRYRDLDIANPTTIMVRFRDEETRDTALNFARREFPTFLAEAVDNGESFDLKMSVLESEIRTIEEYAINQNLSTLRNRVNELGVAEPLVQRQGRGRIVVQLPGVQDTALAKRVIGATATLEFRLEAKPDEAAINTQKFDFRSENRSAIVERDVIITGSSVTNANQSFDETGQPQVNIKLDGPGGSKMLRVTRNAVQRRMAVLFVEDKERTSYVERNGEMVQERERYTEKGLISLATIQSPLGNEFRITGLDSPAEASELALLLRSGALAAPMYFVEERTIGPSLGAQNIEAGLKSMLLGFVLVLIFMVLVYRVFGLFANLALLANVFILIAIMSMFSATLTLPGIAGIVLTVGMAVDANVLIYERIREELRKGMPVQAAIHAGYDRAFVSIFDGNITTLIAAVILFAVGTGPIKGFAITLSIGIATSMFTAIMLTRAMSNLVYGGKRLDTIQIGSRKSITPPEVTSGAAAGGRS
ncbi:MAG: protein translocase subunit SecD [unclassified Hahellaceae]|nr:protein translocase subunit SecD [Hahellaceae bacterium]|tara:strand:- start:30616 stop:32529 length:1914 start_codon:yes stop_codon:yes gene_type:complete